MIDILIISPDSAHTTAVERVIKAGEAHHRVKATNTTLESLRANQEVLDGIDLLIFDGEQMAERDFDTLAALLHQRHGLASMLLTPSPSADLLIRAMRAGVRDVQPWPASANDLRRAIEGIARKIPGARREGRVMSFVSCKGGSGTSFLAANFGFAAAALGRRTLLVDLTQQFGEAAFLVSEMTPPATLADVCGQIDRLDPAFLDACLTHVSDSFDVLAGAADPAKAKEVKAEHVQRILDMVHDQYDVVVLDIGESINNVSIAALDRSEWIFAVMQLNLPYLRAGRRLLDIFRSLGYRSEKIRLLVNRYEKKGSVGVADLEKAVGLKVVSLIPDDGASVSESINQGVPILQLAKSSGVAKAINELARSLSPASAGNRGGILQRLLGKSSSAEASDKGEMKWKAS